MDEPQLMSYEEYIISITLYAVWDPPRPRDHLHALFYLLTRDLTERDHKARFAEINIPLKRVQDVYGGAPLTTGSICEMAGLAANPTKSPLAAIKNPSTWRAIYACLFDELERTFGGICLFCPSVITVNTRTNLIACISMLSKTREPAQGAILSIAAKIPIDPTAIEARAVEGATHRLAWTRLAALQDNPHAVATAALEVSITTKTAYVERTYSSLQAPPVVKTGLIQDIFTVADFVLEISNPRQPIQIRVLIPMNFDYFAVENTTFSAPAILAFFRQWHSAIYPNTNIIKPIFVFLGPEFEPERESIDHLAVLGFPGWPLVRVETQPSPDSRIQTVVAAHIGFDGLWPNIGTFAILTPSLATQVTSYVSQNLPQHIVSEISRWSSTVQTPHLLDPPIALGPVILSHFHFKTIRGALLALLLEGAALHQPPGTTTPTILPRLHRLLSEAKLHPWAEDALKLIMDEVCAAHPSIHQIIEGLLFVIGTHFESIANAAQFAVCGGNISSFWGLFDLPDDDPDLIHKTTQSACRFMELETHKFILSAFDLKSSSVLPSLTLLNNYTHAVLWDYEGYWFWHQDTGAEHLVGFPLLGTIYSEAAQMVKETLRAISPLFSVPSVDIANVISTMDAACDAFLYKAFENRTNSEYWSSQTVEALTTPIPPTAFHGGALLDNAKATKKIVFVGSCESGSVGVHVDLYPKPRILPPIDCSRHLKPILQIVGKIFTGVLCGIGDEETAFKYAFDEKMAFLFAL
ncbi:DNA helicase/primase complex-associated protein [Macropodid alphaherpesvirus 4]|uniref:DNA helicase/primase complex-associated protein n=1 Tax=Macropodid alphaherpesvirus 4 TaxID=2762721 RepID=A0A7L7YV11_9ALPH|nr:DNA helicase/primase complex-associated protein [Macropodid alphaherpesvirus 4]QOD40131.1 DNA helicase/primase complex-associated protein [Macropodid alphaherpesvirus 4]